MKDMKTKEEILKECQLSQPYQEGTWYKGAIEAMQLYSDQQNKVTGETSDGYHTFNELYEHRHVLFLALLKTRIDAWKSWKHEDGSAFDGWFIAGIGDKITYHIPARLWDAFTVPEVANAPKWDGHTSNDVIERLKLLDADQQNKELRERIAVVLSDSALGVEIQRLTTENKELEEKLMSEQIENGYLQGFRVSNEAEIQRLTKESEKDKAALQYYAKVLQEEIQKNDSLTKEVEGLKNDLLDALDLKNGNGPTALTMLSNEITRLRELVPQYLDNSTSDNAYGADVRDRILNELNPKP